MQMRQKTKGRKNVEMNRQKDYVKVFVSLPPPLRNVAMGKRQTKRQTQRQGKDIHPTDKQKRIHTQSDRQRQTDG